MIALEPCVQVNARYNTKETAEILQVDRTTVYRYVMQGFLKAGFRKSTKKKFFTGAEILRFWKASL